MIFFYVLVSAMPLLRHPLWSMFMGDVTVIKIVGGIAAVYAAFYLLTRPSFPDWIGTSQARWYLAFAALSIVSHFVLGIPRVYAQFSPLFMIVSFLLLFFITLIVVDSLSRLRLLLMTAIGSVAFASLYVIREWQKTGMSSSYRPGWVTGDPNYFTVSALICLPIAFYLLQAKPPRWERRFYLVSMVVTLFAVVLAASRGGLLGLTASFLVMVWRSSQRARILTVLTFLLLPTLLVLQPSAVRRFTNPDYSDIAAQESRLVVWEAGLRIMQEHPLTGIGMGNFRRLVMQYEDPEERLIASLAHNTYIDIGAEIGLPGLALFLAMLIQALRSLEKVRRATRAMPSPLLNAAAQGIQAGFVGYAVAIFFVSAIHMKLFWLMLFISMCLPSLVPRGNARGRGRNEPARTLAVSV